MGGQDDCLLSCCSQRAESGGSRASSGTQGRTGRENSGGVSGLRRTNLSDAGSSTGQQCRRSLSLLSALANGTYYSLFLLILYAPGRGISGPLAASRSHVQRPHGRAAGETADLRASENRQRPGRVSRRRAGRRPPPGIAGPLIPYIDHTMHSHILDKTVLVLHRQQIILTIASCYHYRGTKTLPHCYQDWALGITFTKHQTFSCCTIILRLSS